MFCSMLGGDIQ